MTPIVEIKLCDSYGTVYADAVKRRDDDP